ncbi:uncharacterized protein LOC135466425 [Liolophura sinensis]|uniref:uncharacterized protein LOC135466425 n=1 Tax=Liolophura sinensis TaxID=3198878 RepID=UPI003158214F
MKPYLPVLVVVCYQLSGTNGREFPRGQLSSGSEDRFEYLPYMEDAILRMTDTDNNGAISDNEIRMFLATPGVPVFLRNALTEDSVQAADTNQDGQLERYELQVILMGAFSHITFPPIYAIVNVLTFETRQMVQRGEITVPQTPTEIAQTALDVLDTNDNGKLSRDEAAEFYSVVASQNFWEDLVNTATALDADRDNELDLQEIIAVYEAQVERYGPLNVMQLIFYGRLRSILGPVSLDIRQ